MEANKANTVHSHFMEHHSNGGAEEEASAVKAKQQQQKNVVLGGKVGSQAVHVSSPQPNHSPLNYRPLKVEQSQEAGTTPAPEKAQPTTTTTQQPTTSTLSVSSTGPAAEWEAGANGYDQPTAESSGSSSTADKVQNVHDAQAESADSDADLIEKKEEDSKGKSKE